MLINQFQLMLPEFQMRSREVNKQYVVKEIYGEKRRAKVSKAYALLHRDKK